MTINKPDHAAVDITFNAVVRRYSLSLGRDAKPELAKKDVICLAHDDPDGVSTSYTALVTMTIAEGKRELLGAHARVTFVRHRNGMFIPTHLDMEFLDESERWGRVLYPLASDGSVRPSRGTAMSD